eukprot:g25832.t1
MRSSSAARDAAIKAQKAAEDKVEELQKLLAKEKQEREKETQAWSEERTELLTRRGALRLPPTAENRLISPSASGSQQNSSTVLRTSLLSSDQSVVLPKAAGHSGSNEGPFGTTQLAVSEAFLRFTQLGRVVARYAQHPEVEVAKQAREIVEAWRLAIHLKEVVSVYRGRRERFWQFTLQRPFGDDTWYLQVKVPLQNEKKEFSEIKELLHRMAFDLGAQRFAGSGVTESEARNALRLFERELSKANWSEEKFARLGINARVDSR